MDTIADPSELDRTVTDPYGRCLPITRRMIGRYQLVEIIGTGGMGVVYRAYDPELKREVAVKLVAARTSQERARVLREAEALAQLRHPNVVPVFDVGTHADVVYLVMPFLGGGTLRTWMQAARGWRDVVMVFLAAARGLASAHAVGIVHRDFKPENVLLGAGAEEVLVADFGIARVETADHASRWSAVELEPSLTRSGAVIGTPAYMAPEQLDGASTDARADQFGFCVSLYEAVNGERPFKEPGGGDLTRLRAAIRRGVPSISRGPRWLRAAIARGLRDDPAARWPSMLTLVEELERGLGLRRRIALLVGALTILVATVVFAATWRGERAAARPAQMTTWIETPLTFRGDVASASLSPDGNTIAAFAGDDLVVIPTGGGDARVIARGLRRADSIRVAASVDDPVWLPGNQILARRLDGFAAIDLATGRIGEVVGGGPTPIPIGDHFVAIISNGRKIYIRAADGVLERECPVPGDYAWLTDLGVEGDHVLVVAVWPDGSRALLSTTVDCDTVRMVVDRRIASGFIRAPDGQRYQLRGRNHVETVAPLDDSGAPTGPELPLPTRVSDVVGIGADGNFVLVRQTESWRIVEVVGDAQHEIARGTGVLDMKLSPDGRHAAILDRETRAGAPLFIVEADHLERRGAPVAAGCLAVAWSPDGAMLAALVEDDGGVTLETIEATSGRRTPIRCRGRDGDEAIGATLLDNEGLVWLDKRRIAYLRPDHRTYEWIDRLDCTTGRLFEPQLGYTFDVAVSPTDGAIALNWNRIQYRSQPVEPAGPWLVPPSGSPRFLGGEALFAWGPEGSLWQADNKVVVRYDRDLKRRRPVATLMLESGSAIRRLFPRFDRIWVQISNTQSDLVRYGPVSPGR